MESLNVIPRKQLTSKLRGGTYFSWVHSFISSGVFLCLLRIEPIVLVLWIHMSIPWWCHFYMSGLSLPFLVNSVPAVKRKIQEYVTYTTTQIQMKKSNQQKSAVCYGLRFTITSLTTQISLLGVYDSVIFDQKFWLKICGWKLVLKCLCKMSIISLDLWAV